MITFKGSRSRTFLYWAFHILPQMYIMQITQPSQYRYKRLHYRFSVISEAPSKPSEAIWLFLPRIEIENIFSLVSNWGTTKNHKITYTFKIQKIPKINQKNCVFCQYFMFKRIRAAQVSRQIWGSDSATLNSKLEGNFQRERSSLWRYHAHHLLFLLSDPDSTPKCGMLYGNRLVERRKKSELSLWYNGEGFFVPLLKKNQKAIHTDAPIQKPIQKINFPTSQSTFVLGR